MRAAGAAGRAQQDLARQRVVAGLAVPAKALRVFEVREARDGSTAEQEAAACCHLAVSIAGSSALIGIPAYFGRPSARRCECCGLYGARIPSLWPLSV